MKLILKAVASLAILATPCLSGCGSLPQGCTELGCADGVSVSLAKLTATYSAKLPLTIQVCFGADAASCTKTTVKAQTGATLVCEPPSTSSVICTFDMDGTVVLQQPPSASDLAQGKVDVHVTVTDAMSAMLFDKTMTATIQTSTPNGASCPPVCHQADVAFTP